MGVSPDCGQGWGVQVRTFLISPLKEVDDRIAVVEAERGRETWNGTACNSRSGSGPHVPSLRGLTGDWSGNSISGLGEKEPGKLS